MQATARTLLLLYLAALALVSAKQHQQAAQPADRSNVPGQAFHDWRNALVAAKYSGSTQPGGSSSSSSSEADSGGIDQNGAVDKQAKEWVNIVASREAISELKGPAAPTTTHPAAKQRLELAQALIAAATAEADAAAAAAADALAELGKPKGPGAGHADAAEASSAGSGQQQQQQQHGGDERLMPGDRDSVFNDRKLTQQQARTIHTAAAAAAAAAVVSLPSSTVEYGQRLQQLTNLMSQQPYKPVRTDPDVLESTLMHFVQRGPQNRLYLQGKPWLLKGMDVPEALQLAAGGPVPRSQLLYLLDRAQMLGLNTLRFRAFADGAPGVGSAVRAKWGQHEEDAMTRHIALQPAPGILNGTMLREGLDWLVHECSLRGLRLLPVLTNGGSTEGGGMKQYIDWIDPALTVTEFYTNDTIKSVFLDYVASMLGHVNSLTGLPLREDPIVLGWQLAEDASHPGNPSSQTLLAWLRQFGVFVKQRAPHQLLLPGVKDLFGHNSPHHLQYNPQAQVFDAASHSPHGYHPHFHGVDFWLHNQLPELDAVTSGVFPDMHVACNATCKLDWTREWIRAHLRDAQRMNKALILGGIGALRPQTWRLQVLQVVQEEIERALKYGHPIGGFILSGLSHPDMPDTTGWAMYYTSKGVHKERPALDNLNAQAVSDVKWRRFLNYDAFLACQALHTRGTSSDKAEATNTAVWVDGWDDVVRAVAAMAKTPAEPHTARAAA